MVNFVLSLPNEIVIRRNGNLQTLKNITIKGIPKANNVFYFDEVFPFLIWDIYKNQANGLIQINGQSIEITSSNAVFIRNEDHKEVLRFILNKPRLANYILSESLFQKISNGIQGLDKTFLVYKTNPLASSCVEEYNPIYLTSSIFDLFPNRLNEFPDLMRKFMLYNVEKMLLEHEKRIHTFLIQKIKEKYRSSIQGRNFSLKGKAFYLNGYEEILVLTDLHGDLKSLLDVFYLEDVLEKLAQNENFALIFLGDYIDRGMKQINVLRTVLLLQYVFWGKVFLLRGNHEDFIYNEKEGKYFSTEMEDGEDTYVGSWGKDFGRDYLRELNLFFHSMPLFLVEESTKTFMVHGGLPPFLDEGNDIFPYFRNLEELSSPLVSHGLRYEPEMVLWSRVRNSDNVRFFKGKKSYEYAKRQVDAFLGKIGADRILRGHDPEALKIFFDGKVITFHTTGGKGNPHSKHHYGNIPTPTYIKIENGELKAQKIVSPNFSIFPDKEAFTIIEKIITGGES